MSVIEIKSINYKPNLVILEKYIVTFKGTFIYLYNMKGKLLFNNFIHPGEDIAGLFIINNNYLIGYSKYVFFKVIINKKEFEIENIILERAILREIFDIFYSKTNKLLVISYIDNIEIRDINDLNKNPIQIINQKLSFLLNINKDLFFAFNRSFISLYKKINNIKLYQLSTKSFHIYNDDNYFIKLLKLDNKIIMVVKDSILYLINIKTMKTLKKFYLGHYPGDIVFIYKIEDNIYICKEGFLILFKYVENQLLFSKFENNSKNLLTFNILINLFLEKQFPKLYKTITINCIENKIRRDFNLILVKIFVFGNYRRGFFSKITPFHCALEYDLKVDNKYEKKSLKKNELIGRKKIGKNDLRTEKIKKRKNQLKKYDIIYHPQKFKKKYR